MCGAAGWVPLGRFVAPMGEGVAMWCDGSGWLVGERSECDAGVGLSIRLGCGCRSEFPEILNRVGRKRTVSMSLWGWRGGKRTCP